MEKNDFITHMEKKIEQQEKANKQLREMIKRNLGVTDEEIDATIAEWENEK